MGENDSMLEMYLYESSMLLDQLDDILLQAEKQNNLSSESINEIFRIMHTIKGSSAMMEFDLLCLVSHKLEDLFYYVRENGMEEQYIRDLMGIVLEGSDFLKKEIENIQDDLKLSTENAGLIENITRLLARMKGEETVPAEPVTVAPAKTESAVKEADIEDGDSPEDGTTYFLHVHFTVDCQMENVRAFLLVNKLKTLGKVHLTMPAELETDQGASAIIIKGGFYCSLSSTAPIAEIEAAVKGSSAVDRFEFIRELPSDSDLAKISQETKESQSPTESTGEDLSASPDSSSKTNSSKQNLIAVDVKKLDALMDLVGEIVITESMVSGSPDLAGLPLDNFNKASRQLRKLTDELQDIVMSTRMVPIAPTFQKMRRIVRDMNKRFNREVDLVLMGENTEVDKNIIDAVVDPLMHLIRNSMDHGIEDRETRIASQKDPRGQIILSAQNVAGEIIVTVSDDGAGLDASYILEKAKGKNLLTKPESEYTEKEIFQLLTLPGFSTKEAVTEYSGRGVGMDVVKKNIEKIGGTVTIESVKKVGTTVFFKIPLTLAIISSMEVRVGSEVFSIPISGIRESLKTTSDQIITDPEGNEMIMIRGVCYPVIRLDQIYSIEDGCERIDDGILFLVDSSEGKACLLVDEILGKHRVVVKPLPLYLTQFQVSSIGLSGCTILGNGSISLILDVQGIMRHY